MRKFVQIAVRVGLAVAAAITVVGTATDANALLIEMSKHQLDPNAVSQDKEPPGQVGVISVEISRGHATPPGTQEEDAHIGSASIYIRPPHGQ